MREARTQLVRVENELLRVLAQGIRATIERLDVKLEESYNTTTDVVESEDAGWHYNEKGQLVGTVGQYPCLLYVQRVRDGYEWSFAPWRTSGVAATEAEAKSAAIAAAKGLK